MHLKFKTKTKMKKLITLLMVFAVTFTVNAQIETPQPSPLQKIEQKVGLTDVSVQYSRPSMKGRTIFGDLVPYGKLWRTGANQNTMVTFSTDVMVGESTLKAGSPLYQNFLKSAMVQRPGPLWLLLPSLVPFLYILE